MKTFVLIVTTPESRGPGSFPVDVYGLDTREALEGLGHLLCDGSSGWEFVVMPEAAWRRLSKMPLQVPAVQSG